MMKTLLKKVRQKIKNDRATEPFVTFMQVAKEDPDIRRVLLGILSQDEFNRSSILNTYIEEMRYKGAPESFVAALACLLDKDVAQRAYDLLTGKA
jgi:hypothetical protein